MRMVYSYIRLTLASSLFLAGIGVQFVPSAGGAAREARQRERLLQAVPAEDRAEWVRVRDIDDAGSEATLRLFGVLIGGFGFGAALYEAAFVCTRASRHCPLDTN